MQSVLVVEDGDRDQIVVIEILVKNRYFVHHVRTAPEAAAAMDAIDFDLAIFSALAPDRSGELLRRARSNGVAALIITGDPDTIAAFEDNGTPYIARPFLVDDFLEIIRRCVRSRSPADEM